MSDYRSEYCEEVKNGLLSLYDVEDINKIMNVVIATLHNYEINERCTEVAVVDNREEILVKNYLGSILVDGGSKNTVYQYKRALCRFRNYINKSLLEANAMDVRIWLAEMQSKVSLCSCSNYKTYVCAFYRWLHVNKIIKENPMEVLKSISYKKKKRKSFSPSEIDALRSSCKTLRERAIIEFLLASGVRVSELCDLDLVDVNFNTLEVFVKKGKGDKERFTYIDELAAVHLKKYLQSRTDNNPSLFVNRYDNRISKNSTEKELHKIGNRVDMPNVFPHRFRHSMASILFKRGVDLHTIQLLLGHESIQTTIDYISDSMELTHSKYKMAMG